jgi:hypothetical protein
MSENAFGLRLLFKNEPLLAMKKKEKIEKNNNNSTFTMMIIVIMMINRVCSGIVPG